MAGAGDKGILNGNQLMNGASGWIKRPSSAGVRPAAVALTNGLATPRCKHMEWPANHALRASVWILPVAAKPASGNAAQQISGTPAFTFVEKTAVVNDDGTRNGRMAPSPHGPGKRDEAWLSGLVHLTRCRAHRLIGKAACCSPSLFQIGFEKVTSD